MEVSIKGDRAHIRPPVSSTSVEYRESHILHCFLATFEGQSLSYDSPTMLRGSSPQFPLHIDGSSARG